MAKRSLVLVSCLLASLFGMFSCKARHDPSDIVAGMHHYDRLIEKMNVDSIALLYTRDGQLGEAAKGRDSIRNFLKAFSGYTVLSNQSISDAIKLNGDSAMQAGTYTQLTILPSKDTTHIKGQFEARWVWLPGEGWKIARMTTKAVP